MVFHRKPGNLLPSFQNHGCGDHSILELLRQKIRLIQIKLPLVKKMFHKINIPIR